VLRWPLALRTTAKGGVNAALSATLAEELGPAPEIAFIATTTTVLAATAAIVGAYCEGGSHRGGKNDRHEIRRFLEKLAASLIDFLHCFLSSLRNLVTVSEPSRNAR
jgi:hypothetical protein